MGVADNKDEVVCKSGVDKVRAAGRHSQAEDKTSEPFRGGLLEAS